MARSGEVVASLSRAGDLRIQYQNQGQISANLHVPGGEGLAAMALRSDGRLAVAGRTNGGLRVWQSENPNQWTDFPMQTQEKPDGVTSLAFDEQDRTLAVGRQSGRIDLLTLPDFRLARSLTGHSQAINRIRIRGDLMVSAGEDGTARVWGLSDGTCRTILRGSHAGGVTSVDLTPDLTRTFTSCRDWGVRIFDTQTGVEYLAVQWHRYGVTDLALSRDGSTLATLGLDGTLQWWITGRIPGGITP
jgi:WD40 repeat protein